MTTELDTSIEATLHIIEQLEDKLADVEDNEQQKRNIRSQITEQRKLYQWFLTQKAAGRTSSIPLTETKLEKPTTPPRRGWSKYSRYLQRQRY